MRRGVSAAATALSVVVGAGTAVGAAATPAAATTGVTATRLQGGNRYATAAAVAQASFPSGATAAIVASGRDFPDALAGSYAAGRLRAPVLLTDPNQLSTETASALSAMHAAGVTLVGGTAAVSDNVASQLRAAGYTVQRVAGGDRYATAAAVAQSFPASFVGTYGSGGRTAIIATGLTFPDALAGGPVSYDASFPIMLTTTSSLPSATQSALQALAIKQAIVLGGSAAVSPAVISQLQGMGIATTQIGGADRTQTATMVADLEANQFAWSITHVNLARGDDFADALVGGVHGGVEKEPVILASSPNTLGANTTTWLSSKSSTIASIHVLGGISAVSDAVMNAAVTAAR
jgi:putative cell wall-binding protein